MERFFKTFGEWLAMREGLWLSDQLAVAGKSRIEPPPVPPKNKPVARAKTAPQAPFKISISKPAFLTPSFGPKRPRPH